jgi:hypothetical protein
MKVFCYSTKIMASQGSGGTTIGETVFTYAYIYEKYLKIFFSSTVGYKS